MLTFSVSFGAHVLLGFFLPVAKEDDDDNDAEADFVIFCHDGDAINMRITQARIFTTMLMMVVALFVMTVILAGMAMVIPVL